MFDIVQTGRLPGSSISALEGDSIHPFRNTCVDEHDGVVVIDFRRCTPHDLSEIYQAFGLLCARKSVHCVLLKTGDEEADAHYSLRDILRTLALVVEVPLHLHLALVSSSSSIALVRDGMEEELRALGCNSRVFPIELEAYEWLAAARDGATFGKAGAADPGAGAGTAA